MTIQKIERGMAGRLGRSIRGEFISSQATPRSPNTVVDRKLDEQ